MKYKLIALDLDGTLNNSEKKITKKTKDALLRAQELGIKVALVSGRPSPGLMRECKELELEKNNGLLISFNGARVVDATTGECLYEKTIEKNLAKEVLNHLKQFDVYPMLNKDNESIVHDCNGYKVQYEATVNNLTLKEVDDLAEYLNFNPCKILVSAEPEYLESIAEEIKKPFKDKLNIYFSAPYFLEIVSKGIDKGATLSDVLKRLNMSRDELIAFGDERNDLSMIEFAGMGVAMGNAIQELKDIANKITLSNDEDGIAAALHDLINEL